MLIIKRSILVLTLLATLNSCSALFGRDGYFRDRGDDYMVSQEIPPMRVPQGLDSGALSELFVIPPVSNDYLDPGQEFKVPRPLLTSKGERAEVKIQKLAKQRWIVINDSPAVVWPRVKQFLEDNNIASHSEDALSGKIETVWLKLASDPDTKDRYLINIQPGLHRGTTEVSLIQMTVAANVPGAGNVNWPEFSVKPDREKWMLDRLATTLAAPQEGSVSLLAQSIVGSRRVEVVHLQNEEPFMLMAVEYQRAWASVAGALQQGGFELQSENASEGFMTVLFDPEYRAMEEPPGFIAKLFGAERRQKKRIAERTLSYQILVGRIEPTDIRVFCRDTNGESLDPQQAEKVLHLLRSQLL